MEFCKICGDGVAEGNRFECSNCGKLVCKECADFGPGELLCVRCSPQKK